MSSLVLRATHHFFIFLYNSLYPAGLILGPIFSYSLWVDIFFPSAWVTRKMDPYPSSNYSLPQMRLPVSAPHNHDQSGHFASYPVYGFGSQQNYESLYTLSFNSPLQPQPITPLPIATDSSRIFTIRLQGLQESLECCRDQANYTRCCTKESVFL